MSEIRLEKIHVKNYRSFKDGINFEFPGEDYKKPISIIGYNNAGKTNLLYAILYGIGYKYITKDTFSINDFHNQDISNVPEIVAYMNSSTEDKVDGKQANLSGYHKLEFILDGIEVESAKINSLKPNGTDTNWQAFGAIKYFNVFYINFHNIKEEISTKKTSWGNLTSFLAKHIKYLVDSDAEMLAKKRTYIEEAKQATEKVLSDSLLSKFIEKVKINYSKNLRENNCHVEFGLPNYEDIFLQMLFKIGLNGDNSNLIPIEHFGDGYISMFVMAVIQSIAESQLDDKCLFLFEEPESFLHENHQEYFYKMVLCSLAEKGHQVIYTTHSDRMVDVFDTKSIIRLEYDEEAKHTVKKYNNTSEFETSNEDIISLANFNSFIKSIEPNLNRILFSRKVLLVEGPNDLLAYKYAIEQKVNSVVNDSKYSNSYLNFKNIAIVVHHGKSTALLLIDLCKHFGLDYFVVNDWDFTNNFQEEISHFVDENGLKDSELYLYDNGEARTSTSKGMITMNWKLIKNSGVDNIHFNIPKLETVLQYNSDNKSSIGIWERLNEIGEFGTDFMPEKLCEFLELNQIDREIIEEEDDLPF